MTPEREIEILAMEWVIDPPDDSPVRKTGFCTTKTKGIPFQIILIEPKGLWPRTKVRGDTYELARQAAREKLLALERNHRSGVRLTTDHIREATKMKSKLVAVGFDSNDAYEVALEMGFRAYIAQQKHSKKLKDVLRCEKDIVTAGDEELGRLTMTVEEAKNEFLTLIDPPKKSGARDGNTQGEKIEIHLDDLAESMGRDKSFVEAIRNPVEIRAWLLNRIANKDSIWSRTTRVKALQHSKRWFEGICPYKGFPQPSPEVFCRKPEGDKDPIVAIPPKIVDRLLHLLLKKHPRRLMYAVLQAKFGLRPCEAWKMLSVLRTYLKCGWLTVPAHISKTGVQRVILVRPSARAWLAKCPGWSDKRIVNFLEEDFRQRNKETKGDAAHRLQLRLNHYLGVAGWNDTIPKEALRKSWITACVFMGVPIEEYLIQEAGHNGYAVLVQHYFDPTWTKQMARAYFSNFPDGKPSRKFSDYELCHAFNQPKPKPKNKRKKHAHEQT